MVTHTLNSCSAFTHTSAHTHSSEYTHTLNAHPDQWEAIMGSSWRFGALLKGTSSWFWMWRERCTFTPLTDNPCRNETRTRNLSIMSQWSGNFLLSLYMTDTPIRLSRTGLSGENGCGESQPSSWRVDDSQSRPISSLLYTHRYCLSVRHAHFTAVFTASQYIGLNGEE